MYIVYANIINTTLARLYNNFLFLIISTGMPFILETTTGFVFMYKRLLFL